MLNFILIGQKFLQSVYYRVKLSKKMKKKYFLRKNVTGEVVNNFLKWKISIFLLSLTLIFFPLSTQSFTLIHTL